MMKVEICKELVRMYVATTKKFSLNVAVRLITDAAFGFLGNQNSANEGGQTILVIRI